VHGSLRRGAGLQQRGLQHHGCAGEARGRRGPGRSLQSELGLNARDGLALARARRGAPAAARGGTLRVELTPEPEPRNPPPPDADIEAIITKGEKDTAALNSKIQEFTEAARQFTLDGGISLYDYKEEVGTSSGGVGRDGVRLRWPIVGALWATLSGSVAAPCFSRHCHNCRSSRRPMIAESSSPSPSAERPLAAASPASQPLPHPLRG
jgi:hypothetical protein